MVNGLRAKRSFHRVVQHSTPVLASWGVRTVGVSCTYRCVICRDMHDHVGKVIHPGSQGGATGGTGDVVAGIALLFSIMAKIERRTR